MTPEQAVTSSSRSGVGLSERNIRAVSDYQHRTTMFVLLGIMLVLSVWSGFFMVADAIKSLKPTIALHEHPTKIEVIQPKPLLPEVR